MTQSSVAAENETKIRRLERRLDRERRARLEAEQIAEDGMRSLYEANQELDRRILDRTTELHEALRVAEEVNAAKSGFLGQMSHQINTPLNGLLGMLELLSAELPDDQTEAWHASAMRSARRLERLTTRLITYVELESTDLVCGAEERRVRFVLSGVHDRWHGPCLRAGQLLSIELASGTDGLIAAPPELDAMFGELLSNVVEHAGPGGVAIKTTNGTLPGTIVISVTDPGAGIDTAQLAHNHELDASPNQTKHGDRHIHLGLAIVDRIVGGLGGSWESRQDPVSAVLVTLPTIG